MHPCQEGYPCVYLKLIDDKRGTCMCAHCPMRHISATEHHQDLAYDSLTGLVTEWVTVPPPKRQRDPDDEWDEEFTEKEFALSVTTADTLKREHGSLKPKRYAAVR